MYKVTTGLFNLQVPSKEYMESLDKNLTISNHFYKYYNNKLLPGIGKIICPDQVLNIKSEIFSDLHTDKIQIIALIKFINFLPVLNSNVLALVQEIDPKGNIISNFGPYKTFIHNSQLPSSNFKYNKVTKSLVSTNKKQIKIGDILKSKLVEFGKNQDNYPRIRLSLRQPMLGKTSWWD
jgi:DNA-directed RNA polymerase subunit E'/Rpb7